MASLSTTAIQRPVLAIVMNLLIIIFGYIGFKYLGVREYPAIDPPVVTVRTNYTGANADIIESQITEPLEKAVNGIQGIKLISSSSNQGNSSITVEFELGISLEQAANDVRDKVSQTVRSLPQDIDGPPVVSKADANADPIIIMNLQSPKRNILEINDWAENVLLPRLQTIPGVANVNIFGGKRYSMRLRLDPTKLAAYKLTALEVRRALDRENVELPSGKIAGNTTELTVKTSGRLTSPDEFNNMIVLTDGDKIVRMRDVGTAEFAPENEETMLRVNGAQMVAMGISPQPGANYLEIADEFYKRFEQLKKELPADFSMFIPIDTTPFVRKSIKEVGETLFIAILLVILVIYAFFRDWVVAFRPLIDIPVSLIGTFFVMYIFGFSINVLTLLAIVLATGLVVDDGIVVTENIYKKIEAGMPPVQAAILGANEIFFAVISTSITLAAVFLPIVFLDGFTGRLFREFGVVIASAVLISAFVSLTLTPMLNAYLVRKHAKPTWFYTVTEPFYQRMDKRYHAALSGFMGVRWVALGLLAGAFTLIYVVYPTLPSELSPMDDRSGFRLGVTLPEGASYEYTDYVIKNLGQLVTDSIPEQEAAVAITAPANIGSGSLNTGFVRIKLTDPEKRKRTQMQIAADAARLSKRFTEARIIPVQEQTISVGLLSRFGLPVQFVIQAANLDKLREVLPKFMEKIQARKDVFAATDVNLKFNKPELDLQINRDKARSLGVSVLDVAQTLQLAFGGSRWGYFPMNGKQYQVVGQVDRMNRDEPSDLKSLYVKNAKGEMIQLDNVVELVERSAPPQLYHFNRYMSATVSASLMPNKTIGDGIKVMEQTADSVLTKEYSTALSGPSRDFKESSSNIGFAFYLALLLIYLILAGQFESFIDPFIILLTVPLALAGALLSLWYFNQSLNIFSQIGIIMLIGLVTKNGILIVEFANQLIEQGVPKQKAIVDAAAGRLRPILMTSIATVLGAMPIALALGAGAKSRMSMGIVIVGGLLFSLILTLYVIPAMYYLLSRKKIHTPEPSKSTVTE